MGWLARWRQGGSQTAVWLSWLAAASAITVRPFFWHIDYYRIHGPQFHRIAFFFFTALAVLSVIYAAVRRRFLWRYEPAILTLGAIAACMAFDPMATLVSFAIFLPVWAAGRFLSRTAGLDKQDALEGILVASGLGFGALICLLFVLGVFRLYYPLVFGFVLVLAAVLFRSDMRAFTQAVRGLLNRWAETDEIRQPSVGVTLIFAAILVVFATVVVLAPSTAFDVLAAHLVSVRYYASQHALLPVPTLDYSYFPQGDEVLMTFAYMLGGQAAAQMITALFFVLFVLFSFRLALEWGSSPAGAVLGAFLMAAIPFLHWTGSVAKNDLCMAFFQIAALFCYLRWNNSQNFRWIQVGVFFLAMSFGVKHVALFGGIPIGLLYLKAIWTQPQRTRAGLSLLLIFCVFGLFWHARTYLLTGNPVYPQGLRSSVHTAASDHNQSGLQALLRYAAIPWQVHFNGTKAFESPSANPLGIFLVLFLPVWVLVRPARPNRAERACLIFCGIYLAYWSTALTTLRYAIVPVAVLFLSMASRVERFYEASSRPVRASILGGIIYCFLFGIPGLMINEINAPQLALFSGGLDKAGYLRQVLVVTQALQFLQKHASIDDRIFVVEAYSRAYAPNPVMLTCEPCGMPGSCSAADVLKELDKVNYAYMILPDTPMYESVPGNLKGTQVFDDGQYAVYRLEKAR